ncbi:P-type DNA transfer protein VirB5 [Legionella pneumophila]|uniref:type IV secretion system protein n=1 Tax=Legionella pneumophila TaxID=446 RepID=UPI000770B67D|nr:type IV secretion system protein [Legionella pneumophila]MDW9149531.1 type IV secretion system protein [Legionella pneumophila]CZJ09601.1 P-type DNA transfer protein VirB5 [Legionella pneumophila]
MKRAACFLIAAMGISSASHADILGVEDAQLILLAMKQLGELQEQYRVLSDTYQTARSQLDNLNQLKSMNSGHYGFGDFNNSLDSLQSWQSPVSTWQDALQNLSGGNQQRYQALMEAYEKNHPALDEASYSRFTTPANVMRFKEDKAVNRAVMVQTTESYNEINKHMEALHKLSQQIEKTPNTKGAIDLNSRLITEIGFIQLMSLRLQALISQQAAQENLSALQDRAEMAKFNRLPK